MEYSRDLDNIQKDLEELQILLAQHATRDFTKKLLEKEISHLKSLQVLMEQNVPKQLNKPEVKEQQQEETKDYIKKDQVMYSMLTKYGWEQDDKFVKVYLTSELDGIGKHEKKNIDCEFTDNSIDLRVLDFHGKNLRLKIQPLNNIIDPASCKMKIKTNSLTLELRKNNKKHWDDIKEKKSAIGGDSSIKKKSKGVDEEGSTDPSASLMTMMKELYETGDDQMKRTIAESWEKAQKDKKGGLGGI